MRAVMPREFPIHVTRWDDTGDGFSVVTIEACGRLVATTVLSPADCYPDWFVAASRWLHDEVLRRC